MADRLNTITGLSGYSDFDTVITGLEFNPKLQGTQKYDVYSEMGYDPVIFGILETIENTVLDGEWSLQGGRDDVREFVESWLMPTLQKDNASAIKYLKYGNWPMEQLLTRRKLDGKIIDKLLPRQPWSIYGYQTKNNELTAITQITDVGEGIIPAGRLVLFVRKPDGDNYEGVSLIRPCYFSFQQKYMNWRVDLSGTQRFANGTLVIKTDTAGKDKRTKAQALGAAWASGQGSYVVYDESDGIVDIEIVNSTGTPYDASSKVSALNAEMATALLSQFIQYNASGLGSQAELVKESVERWFSFCQRIADDMAAVHNTQRIQRIVDKNFTGLTKDDYPKLTVAGINKPDVKMLTEAINTLSTAWPAFAASLNEDDLNITKSNMGLTVKDEEKTDTAEKKEIQKTVSNNLSVHLAADRDLNELEKFADWAGMEETLDTGRDDLAASLAKTAEKMQLKLVKFLVPLVVAGDVDKIQTARAGHVKELNAKIEKETKELRKAGAQDVTAERARALGESMATDKERIFALDDYNERQALLIERAMNQAGVDSALSMVAADAIDEIAIASGLTTAIDRTSTARVRAAATGAANMAYIQARSMTAKELGYERELYSAVMDKQTCGPCADNDGKTIIEGEPTVPNPDCLGDIKCRCIAVYQWS